jgi:hypothetical protein
MFALISPLDPAVDYNQNVVGIRIIDVKQSEYPVASPYFWVPCDDNVTINNNYYKDGVIYEYPPLPPSPITENITTVVSGTGGPNVIA